MRSLGGLWDTGESIMEETGGKKVQPLLWSGCWSTLLFLIIFQSTLIKQRFIITGIITKVK